MAISSSEIKLIYSGALASNTNANDSYGGQISTDASVGSPSGIISSGVLNNDMDDITSAEAASGITIYHAYYYKNTNSTLTYIAPKIYIESNTGTNETESYIGVPPELKNVSVQRLTTELTPAPTNVTFSAPANYAAGLALLDLPSTNYRGIWVKYVVDASASAVLDQYTLGIQGDSNP